MTVEPRGFKYNVRYTPVALGHLRLLSASQQTIVIDAVEDQLTHQAEIRTRNRKPLRPNELAAWELRLGVLRVFYTVESDKEPPSDTPQDRTKGTVVVAAVGVKQGNRLLIGGEEFDL